MLYLVSYLDIFLHTCLNKYLDSLYLEVSNVRILYTFFVSLSRYVSRYKIFNISGILSGYFQRSILPNTAHGIIGTAQGAHNKYLVGATVVDGRLPQVFFFLVED